MPDSTGRDARLPMDPDADPNVVEENKKLIIDALTKIMQRASLNDDSANAMGFVMPATDDEPEKFVRLADMERSLEDMALVHEIAINDKFQLKPTAPDTAGYLLQKTMKDAYWDLLAEELAQEPPCYRMVIQLLLDIKETFTSLLGGNNDRALAAITAVLDEGKVRRLAEEHGAVVLEQNARMILKFMSLACCPARDAEIEALQRETVPIRQLRGIMEVLDKMKLDMANFVLMTTRTQFVRYSVEYERRKFGELQKLFANRFPATEAWLERNKPAARGGEGAAAPAMVQLVEVQMPDYFIEAYEELIQPGADHPFPELLKLDYERMVQMRETAMRLATCATVMQLTCAAEPALAKHERRCELAAKLAILSEDYPGKTALQELLESLSVQALDCVAPFATADGTQLALRGQILSIDGNMSVYGVIWRKLMQYMRDLVMAEREDYVPLPVCYRDYGNQVRKLAGQFKRIVWHNFEVYGTYYLKTMQEA